MVRLFKVYAVLIFILLSSAYTGQIYSQSQFTDSITTGKSYRFIMYNESEVTGIVLSKGNEYIKILSESGDVLLIRKQNILFYSPDIMHSKLKYSVSLLGGVSLISSDNYSNNVEAGINVDVAGIYYYNDSKGVKLDFGYSFIKNKQDDNMPAPLIYPYYPTTYEGGDISYYSLKGNWLLGMFNPAKQIMFYGSLGFGFQVTHMAEIYEQYYDYNDSLYRNITVAPENNINAVLSIGCGLVVKISKRLGIHAEMEYNLVTTGEYYRSYNSSRSYFPVRLGLMYSIF